jgi:hypothetical protein
MGEWGNIIFPLLKIFKRGNIPTEYPTFPLLKIFKKGNMGYSSF